MEGDVTITPDGGGPVRFGAGDLVVFDAGLSCTWDVHAPGGAHADTAPANTAREHRGDGPQHHRRRAASVGLSAARAPAVWPARVPVWS